MKAVLVLTTNNGASRHYHNPFIIARNTLHPLKVSANGPFCRYCGSSAIRDATVYSMQDRALSFTPSIDVGAFEAQDGSTITPFSIKPGLDYKNANKSGYTFPTKACGTCKQPDAIDERFQNTPREIILTHTNEAVILPYALNYLLVESNYDTPKLEALILQLRDTKLEKFRKEWVKKGNVPCKCGKWGFKFNLDVDGEECEIWVLINIEDNRRTYRFGYGGQKVCQ